MILTDLHVKIGFYRGVKAHRWKGGGMGRNNRFISIYYFHNRWRAEIEIEFAINCTAIVAQDPLLRQWSASKSDEEKAFYILDGLIFAANVGWTIP